MASKFTITAELNLQTKNLNQVVGNLKKQFAGANLNIKIKDLAQAQAQIQKIGTTAKQSSKSFGDFANGIVSATRRFTALTAATATFVGLARAIKSGVGEAITFEREVVKIAQATGQTKAQLAGLTKEITNVSTSLGASSAELIVAARNLTQAGIAADKVKGALKVLAQTELAATFDSIADTTEGAIALLNQFGRDAQRTGTEVQFLERSLSAINQVSKDFAVESSDLITAIRTTGSAFESAGGNLDELLALFTSIRSTTRESAESISTGLRTIFTRMQRVDTINNLKALGIELQDAEGKFVGPIEATKRLSAALNTIDPRDFRFNLVVEQLGGFRQVSKVIPLIQQFNVSQRALNTAQQSSGSLAKDAATAQQSLAVQIDRVKEEFKALIRELTETSTFKTIVSDALSLASAMIKVASSIKPIIPLLASVAAIKLGQAFVPAIRQVTGMGMMRKAQGGQIHHFASGGLVPGVGNSDTVPAMLSPGEFVIRKSSVNSLGIENLAKMNKHGIGGKETGASFRKKYMEDDSSSSLAKFQASGAKEGAAERAFLKSGLTQFDKEFGAVFLRPNDIEEDIPAKVSLADITDRYKNAKAGSTLGVDYITEGLKEQKLGNGISFKIHSASIDSKFKDKFQESLFGDLIKLVDNNADSLMRDAGVPVEGLNEGATYKLLKASNLDQTLGNIFEATLKTASGKFADTADTGAGNQPFDFPTGLGGRFDNILTKKIGSIPTDAKTSFTDKSIISLINKARDYIAQEAIEVYANKEGIQKFFKKSSPLATLKSDPIYKSLSNQDESLEDFAKRYGYETIKGGNTKFKKVANGGSIASLTDIPWMSKGGETDTVPAMLTPGEFVINKASAQKIGYSALDKMNKVGKFAKGGAVNVKHFATGGMTSDDEVSINNFIRKLDEAGVGLQKLAEVKDILYAVANESEHLVGAMKSVERIIQSNPSQKNEQFSSLQTQRILNAAIQGGVKNPSQGKEARLQKAQADALAKEQEKRIKQEKRNNKELEDTAKKNDQATNKINENLVLFGSLAASTAVQFSGFSDALKEGISAGISTFGAIYSLGKSLADMGTSMAAAKNASKAAAMASLQEADASIVARNADLAESAASQTAAGGSAAKGGIGALISGISPLTAGIAGVAAGFAILQGVESYYAKKAQEAADASNKLAESLSNATSANVRTLKSAFTGKVLEDVSNKGYTSALSTETSKRTEAVRARVQQGMTYGEADVAVNNQLNKNTKLLSDTFYDSILSLNESKQKLSSDLKSGDLINVMKSVNTGAESVLNSIEQASKDVNLKAINEVEIQRNEKLLNEYNSTQEAVIGKLKESYTKSDFGPEAQKIKDAALITAMSLAKSNAARKYESVKDPGLKQELIFKDTVLGVKSVALAFTEAEKQSKQTQLAIARENALREQLLGTLNQQIALEASITAAKNNLEDFQINLADKLSRLTGEGQVKSNVPSTRALEQLKPGKDLESTLKFIESKNLGGGVSNITQGLRQSAEVKQSLRSMLEGINLPPLAEGVGGKTPKASQFIEQQLKGIAPQVASKLSAIIESQEVKIGDTGRLKQEDIEKIISEFDKNVKDSSDIAKGIVEVFANYETAQREAFAQIIELTNQEAELKSKAIAIQGEVLENRLSFADNPRQKRAIQNEIMANEVNANVAKFGLTGKDEQSFRKGGVEAVNGLLDGIREAQAQLAKGGLNDNATQETQNRIKRLNGALDTLAESSKTLAVLQQQQADAQQQVNDIQSAQEDLVFGGQENRMQTAQTENFLRMFLNNPMFQAKIAASGGLNDEALKNIQQFASKFRNVELGPGLGNRTGQDIINEIIRFQGNPLGNLQNRAEARRMDATTRVEGVMQQRRAAIEGIAGLKGDQANALRAELAEIKSPEELLRKENTIQLQVLNTKTEALNKSLSDLGVNLKPLTDERIKNLTDEITKLKDEEVKLKDEVIKLESAIKNFNGQPIPPMEQGERKFSSGGVVYAANGKYVNFKPQGTDTVPAMLSPGEFVIRKSAVDKVGADKLHAINSGNYKAFGGYPTWMDRSSNWMDNNFLNTSNAMMSSWYNYATAPDRAFGQFSNYMYNSFNDTAFGMIDAFNQTAMNGFAGVGGFSPLNMQFSNNMPMNIGLPFAVGGLASKRNAARKRAEKRAIAKGNLLKVQREAGGDILVPTVSAAQRRAGLGNFSIGSGLYEVERRRAEDIVNEYADKQDEIKKKKEYQDWAAQKRAEATAKAKAKYPDENKDVVDARNKRIEAYEEEIRNRPNNKKIGLQELLAMAEKQKEDQKNIRIERDRRNAERGLAPIVNTPPSGVKIEESDSWIDANAKTFGNPTLESRKKTQDEEQARRNAEKSKKDWDEANNRAMQGRGVVPPRTELESYSGGPVAYWHGIPTTPDNYIKLKAEEDAKNKAEIDEKTRQADEAAANVRGTWMSKVGNWLGTAFATGGIVPSTGFAKGGIKNIGSTDKIPAMLTPGEFVMNERAVKKYGTHAMNKLNNGQMQGFATGGIVGGVTYAAGGGAIGGGPAVDMSSINNAINSAFATGSKYIQDALGNNPLTESLNQFSNNIQSFVDKLTNINMTHTVNLQGSVTVAGLNVNEINDVITKNIGNLIKEKIQDYMSNTNKQWKPG